MMEHSEHSTVTQPSTGGLTRTRRMGRTTGHVGWKTLVTHAAGHWRAQALL